MDRDYGVQEIDLIDLLFYILRRWRVLLIGMVVMALGFPSLMFIKNHGGNEAATGGEIEEKTETVLMLEEGIEAKKTYADQSLLMQVNPYAENMVTLYYYVDTDYQINLSENIEENPVKDIVREYRIYLQTDDVRRCLADEQKLDADLYYIGELIDSYNETDNRFAVSIIGVTEEQAEQIADQIEKLLEAHSETVQETFGQHKLKLIHRTSVCLMDWELYDKQKEVYDSIESMQAELDKLGVDWKEDEAKQELSQEQKRTSYFRLKYIAIGGTVGLFIVVCVMVAVYLLAGTLHKAEEMERVYQIPLIGTIIVKGKRNNPIDRLIDWMSGKTISTEAQVAQAIEIIRMICKEHELKRLYITGSKNWIKTNEDIIQKITVGLEINGIELIYGDRVLVNAENLKKMNMVGKVILLEKIEASKYRDVYDLKKKITLCGSEILGSIVLQG